MVKLKVSVLLLLLFNSLFSKENGESFKANERQYFNKNDILSDYVSAREFKKMSEKLESFSKKYNDLNLFDMYIPAYPAHSEFNDKLIKKDDLRQVELDIQLYWMLRVLSGKIISSTNWQVFKNCVKGDDCMFGFYVSPDQKEKVMIVNSRVITYMAKNISKISLERINENHIYAFIKREFNSLGLSTSGVRVEIKEIYKNEEIYYGEIVPVNFSSSYLNELRNNRFLITSNYSYFQISKVNHPGLFFMEEKIQPRKVLGGITAKDKKSYKPFTGDNIDWEKEFNRYFPNVQDSVQKWLDNAFPLRKGLKEQPIILKKNE